MANTPKSEDFGYEDPLENLLDEESDEEFGLPEFKEHLADELTPAVLKDWTAQDFASIYVRFRPHLERHARRFLNNQTQVEEVVQDAFLYLMTTLPELDSELGVLKFLKWKTRLLALDVIRANSKRYIAPLDEQPDLAADLPEMGIELERAEDAAIVSLALAKLQPRHREALIASVYEEKSTEVVAAQLGLSENATRQLLFRARAAFKKALVGEAETAGLSISQILSLAAKKAAQESGKILGAAGALLLVLAISLGVVPGLLPSAVEEQVAEPAPTITSNPNLDREAEAIPGGQSAEVVAAEPTISSIVSAVFTVPATTEGATRAEERPEQEELAFIFDETFVRTLTNDPSEDLKILSEGQAGQVQIAKADGLTANVIYDLSLPDGVQKVWFNLSVSGTEFGAVAKNWVAQKTLLEDGNTRIDLGATSLLVGDLSGVFGGAASEKTSLSSTKTVISLVIASSGQVLSADLRVIE